VCEESVSDAFEQVRGRLASARSLLIIAHARPDGDTLGSCAALRLAARAAGKDAQIVVPDVLPGRYEFLFADRRPVPPEQFDHLATRSDLLVVLDTCARMQLDDIAESLERYRDKTVVIDHHSTRDELGAVRWIDTTASATGIMLGELLTELDWPMGPETLEALLVAVGSDTGWFRYSNTDARTLRTVADWVASGVQIDETYSKLYESGTVGRIRLLHRMLGSLELHCDQKLAVMTLLDEDFRQAGAAHAETEDLVNEAFRIGSVRAAVLLVESPEAVRVSLRSRGGVDVAALAQRFGGGGHARAAGFRTRGQVEPVKHELIREFQEQFGG